MTMAEIDDRVRSIKPAYGYYRQPNGWITVSPMAELDELHYRQRGWEPLKQYGRFDMATEYAADHPLELLFLRGGVRELSREQIIESALHLNPPKIPGCGQPLTQYHKRHGPSCWQSAQPVEFPQLTEADYETFPCRFCERDPFPTIKGRDSHETVMHREERTEIRSGEILGKSIVEGLKSMPTGARGKNAE